MIRTIDHDDITEFDKVKDQICFRLINTERNKDMLKETPSIEYLDMSIIFYIILGETDNDIQSFIICKALMTEYWHTDIDTIHNLAIENTQRILRGRVATLDDMYVSILRPETYEHTKEEPYDLPAGIDPWARVHIASNTKIRYGAAVILYPELLKRFSDIALFDFYIIPLSIHEVYFYTDYSVNVRELKDIMKETNRRTRRIDEDDILSDNIYVYDKEHDCVKIAK